MEESDDAPMAGRPGLVETGADFTYTSRWSPASKLTISGLLRLLRQK